MMPSAYEEGWDASYESMKKDEGKPENPYPITDPDHDKWENGYWDAQFYESGEYW